MKRQLLSATALLALSAPVFAQGHGHDHDHAHGDLHYRIFAADTEAATLSVFDADSDEVQQIELAAAARVNATAGGTVLAFMRSVDAVAVLDSGLTEEDHDDHAHLVVGPAALTGLTLTGSAPVHFNQGAGHVAVFFDGDGSAAVWREAALARGEAAPAFAMATGSAHHGLAMPVAAGVFISVPAAGASLPQAVALMAMDGSEILHQDCPDMHGSAATARFAAFGCVGGVAVFDMGATPPTARFIANPEGATVNVRNLRAGSGYDGFVADWGPEALAILDPVEADGGFFPVALPAPRMAYALNAAGDVALALLSDGSLFRVNALTGADMDRIEGVTAAYSMERGVIRPMVAQAGKMLAVSDPAAGEVVLVDLDHWEVAARVAVGGQPQSLAMIAVEEDAHDH